MTDDDDAPCTDCGDTGITYQTERVCSCHAGMALRPRTPAPVSGDMRELYAKTIFEADPQIQSLKKDGVPINLTWERAKSEGWAAVEWAYAQIDALTPHIAAEIAAAVAKERAGMRGPVTEYKRGYGPGDGDSAIERNEHGAKP